MINTIVVEDNVYIQKHFMNLLDAARFRVVDSFRDAFEAEEACRGGNIDLVSQSLRSCGGKTHSAEIPPHEGCDRDIAHRSCDSGTGKAGGGGQPVVQGSRG